MKKAISARKAESKTKMPSAEAQLKSFVDKFEPKNQALIRTYRNALRKRLPTANELYGAKLPDPHKLLQGSGSQNRFLRLGSTKELERPEVEALIAAAVVQGKNPLPKSGKGKLMIRSISAKQRPRRGAGKKS
jgi:hypothetical protein